MSTQTHPTSRTRRTPEPTTGTGKSRPAGRAIVASVVAGAVAALVLALVVFPGGTEATITGSLLLGFGFGWALMAVVTTRRTRQPQRWAYVPAVAMGATGTALVFLNPGNQTLTALNWVWPPLMVALTAWMFVQMRRWVTGKARWVLTPVLAVLALASIGATYANIAGTSDQSTVAAPGTLYDVGGHRLHLDCHGRGAPTVLLSNGLGEFSASWARVAGPVAATTRVCAYDRAGQGWSSDADSPQDGVTAARDLHTLLAVAGEHGPYVLVGHSIGGTYSMTYAAEYPEQIAGLVLLDSSSPEQFSRMPDYPGQYALMRRGLALLPTLDRLGLARAFTASPLPAPAGDQVEALTATAHAARNGRDEVSMIPEVFEQAQALTTLHDRPLAVLTASENLTNPGWTDAQDELAALSTHSVHRVVDSSHEGLVADEGGAAASVRAITQIVTSVRTGAPLVTR